MSFLQTANTPIESDVAYEYYNNTDYFYFYSAGVVYRKINTGSWGTYVSLNLAGSSTSGVPILKPYRGTLALLIPTQIASEWGVELIILNTVGTKTIHTTIEAHDANNTQPANVTAICILHTGTSFIYTYFMWNGFFRTMGTNYRMVRKVNVGNLTSLGSIVDVAQVETTNPELWIRMPADDPSERVLAAQAEGSSYRFYDLVNSAFTSASIGITEFPPQRGTYVTINTLGLNRGVYGVLWDGTTLMAQALHWGTGNRYVIASVTLGSTYESVATGCSLNADKTVLYLYFVYRIPSDGFGVRYSIYSVDVTPSLIVVGRTLTLESELPTNEALVTPSLVIGGGVGGVKVRPTTSIVDIHLRVHVEHTVPDSWYWNDWVNTVTVGVDSELTTALTTSGGRAIQVNIAYITQLQVSVGTSGNRHLTANVQINTLARLLYLLDINASVAGILIQPQNERYFLEITGNQKTQIPMEWFVVRKSVIAEGKTNVEITVSAPKAFSVALPGLVGGEARLFKIYGGTESDMAVGILSSYTESINTVELRLLDVETTATGTISVGDIFYIRNRGGKRTLRLPPYSNISAGQTIKTRSADIISRNTTLFVSQNNNSFLEVT